jgi:hypothetical protein
MDGGESINRRIILIDPTVGIRTILYGRVDSLMESCQWSRRRWAPVWWLRPVLVASTTTAGDLLASRYMLSSQRNKFASDRRF